MSISRRACAGQKPQDGAAPVISAAGHRHNGSRRERGQPALARCAPAHDAADESRPGKQPVVAEGGQFLGVPPRPADSTGRLRLRPLRDALPGIVASEVLRTAAPRHDSLPTALDPAGLVPSLGKGAALPCAVVAPAIALPTVPRPLTSRMPAGSGAVRHALSITWSSRSSRGTIGARAVPERPAPRMPTAAITNEARLARMGAGAQARRFDVEPRAP